MVITYTNKWNGFQFRAPSYLDGHFEPYKFDLVKWEKCSPFKATDWVTGEEKFFTDNCFTIGTLIWDEREQCFEFKSCGLRYLKYRIDGLENFILDFCGIMKKQLEQKCGV